MNTEQRSIPTKPIDERTVALVTAVAALLIGGLPGTAYSGQYLNDYLKDRGWTGLAFSLYHGPEEHKYPNGERSVVECWGSNCVQNYDQCHCFVTFWDERGNVEYQEEWWGDKRAQTTYDDKGNSTTVRGDPSTGEKEVIIKDFDGVVISDTTYTYDHLGNLKTGTFKDKCGNILSQITCTYTYDDKGVVSRSCKDEHGVEKHPDASAFGLAGTPDGNGPAGSGRGQAGQVGSPGGVGVGNTQAVAPGSASAIGGTAGVAGTNAAVVRHPGQSFKGLKRAQGGTAGAAGPATGTATGGTAGVAGTSATPSGGGDSATGGTAGVGATPADVSQREPKKSPTPAVTATPAGRHLRKRLTVPITAGSATPALTPSGHGGSGHGGTAGVASGSSGQSDAGNKRKIIWQKSSSAATNVGGSATVGTAGVAGPSTTTGSGGSGTNRRKSHSKKSLSGSSNANVQGSAQPGGSVHPTPSPAASPNNR